MKNRILAALLALVLGVPLYLLAADAAPTAAAKTVSSAAPAQAVALLKARPSAEDLAAAMTPETDAAAMIAQTRADLQREIERQTGPKGIDLSWWQSHYNDIIGYIYSPGTHEVFSTSLSADQLQRFINTSTFYSGKGVPSGQIVTLCTCSYEAANYRYVVLGELVKLEDAPADTATEAAA